MLKKKSLQFSVSPEIGNVSAILFHPDDAKNILVFAHGAGAGISSKFMEQVSNVFAEENVATFRFNFPYMENGKKVSDNKKVSIATVSTAVKKAKSLCPKLNLFAGGKSFGGRMTSTAASEGVLDDVKGIVFFGFPLHAPGRASNERAEHLYSVNIPMLFLQGTRDSLASLEFLKPVIKKLGKKAELFIIDGADHSFHIPRDYKMSDGEAINLMCGEAKRWMETVK